MGSIDVVLFLIWWQFYHSSGLLLSVSFFIQWRLELPLQAITPGCMMIYSLGVCNLKPRNISPRNSRGSSFTRSSAWECAWDEGSGEGTLRFSHKGQGKNGCEYTMDTPSTRRCTVWLMQDIRRSNYHIFLFKFNSNSNITYRHTYWRNIFKLYIDYNIYEKVCTRIYSTVFKPNCSLTDH